MTALDIAIAAIGGVNKLAIAVGVRQSLVSMWRFRKNVPAEYCPRIERATSGAVRCEDLRPDVDWQYLRGTKKAKAR